jgi:uncharacterized repeat protein (TIGR03803 family)
MTTRFWAVQLTIIVLAVLGGLAEGFAADGQYTILRTHQRGAAHSFAALTSDGLGNLYGTTAEGGLYDRGTVFKVKADGTDFQVLRAFSGSANDGHHPDDAVVLGSDGNLYGTTRLGGASGVGAVYAMRTDGTDFRILHSFSYDSSNGRCPFASLTLDGSGNMFGTTYWGGTAGRGTVFKLRTDGTGFQVLHHFAGGPSDGESPLAPVVLDGDGYLYGTTVFGGQWSSSTVGGTVFRLKTDGTGFQLLYSFDGSTAGNYPANPLVLDGAGFLYGSTPQGGLGSPVFGGGTVFKLKTDGSGFVLLRSFASNPTNTVGESPRGSIILDGQGNLYGALSQGGSTACLDIDFQGCGAVIRMKTDGTGLQVLHSFTGASDGNAPHGLLLDGSGALYGTNYAGGVEFPGFSGRLVAAVSERPRTAQGSGRLDDYAVACDCRTSRCSRPRRSTRVPDSCRCAS